MGKYRFNRENLNFVEDKRGIGGWIKILLRYFFVSVLLALLYYVVFAVFISTEQERELTYTNASSPMLLQPAKWAKIVIKSNHNGTIGGPDISVDDTMGENSSTEIIDPESGTEIIEGNMNLPKIYVDTTISDAIVIDCVLDVD